MEIYNLSHPTSHQAPILLSVPHCGTAFPDSLRDEYKEQLIQSPDDTDWFVDQLYDFAPSMGISIISAKYSRWVIDLNRDPQSKPLYNDGRLITGLCTTTTFLGEPIYRDERKDVHHEEIRRRLNFYYWPYHQKIQQLLSEHKEKFGSVLLWDCHSIRQIVSTIQPEKFPDLILGTADERSASKNIVDIALNNLSIEKYELKHNHPFKGGFITRHFGKPELRQHALQLEMSKINYMDDSETVYDKSRARKMQEVLKRTLNALSETLIAGKDS